MGNKRDLNTIARLLEKFGDVRLSEAKERLRNPLPGRTLKWDKKALGDVLGGVEAIKLKGLAPMAAYREFASYCGLEADVVAKRYKEAFRFYDRVLGREFIMKVAMDFPDDRWGWEHPVIPGSAADFRKFLGGIATHHRGTVV